MKQDAIKHKLQQDAIFKAEGILKDKYGYTKEALESIGLDCPTAGDYLNKLDEEINNLEMSKMLNYADNYEPLEMLKEIGG